MTNKNVESKQNKENIMLKKQTNTKSKNVEETKRRTIMEQEKVVIYTQVATQEQAKEGYSLEAQQENLRKYAKENNLEIIKEFSDIGSAQKTKKQGFQEMLKFLEDSKDCKCILVTKADRLSRNFKTLSELQEKYSVVSADCGANDMLNQLQIMLAQQYSKQMSERIKAGIQKRKEKAMEISDSETTSGENKASEWIENWVKDCNQDNVEGE